MNHAASDERGWRAYQPWLLSVYDWWVHGVSNRWFWKCPTSELLELYRQNLGASHLDVGVGTGTLLIRALKRRNPSNDSPLTRIALADANPLCLTWASRKVHQAFHQVPESIQVDFLDDSSLPHSDNDAQSLIDSRFDSVALVYLLHCIGTEAGKRRAIEFAAQQLAPHGTCFGATLLGQPIAANFAARRLERIYQRKGIFANQLDSEASVTQWLQASFRNVQTRCVGRALLFTARH